MQKYQDVVLNQNGNPVSGVQVTVTDLLGTPVSVYSANAIGLNVNPLTSDNNGRFSFYAPDGRYNLSFSFGGNVLAGITDILLEDPMDGSDAVFNDVTILGELSDASKVTSAPVGGLTATNVQAALAELDSEKIDASSLASPGGSALVGSDDGASGSLWTTVSGFLSHLRSSAGAAIAGFVWSAIPSAINKVDWGIQTASGRLNVLRYIPPAEWPAIFNGTSTTDVTAYIQQAAVAAKGSGAQGSVFLPNGVYRISRVGIRDVVLVGASRDGVVVKAIDGASSGFMFDATINLDGVTPNTNGNGWCENMTIDGNSTGRSGLRTYGGGATPNKLLVKNCNYGISMGLPIWGSARNCYLPFNGIGFHTYSGAGDAATSLTVENVWAYNCTTYGFHITQLYYSSFINCASQNTPTGWYVEGNAGGLPAVYSLQFIGCGHEGTGQPFLFKKVRDLTLIGPRVIDSASGVNPVKLDDCTGSIIDYSTPSALPGGAYHLEVVTHSGGVGALKIIGGAPTYNPADNQTTTAFAPIGPSYGRFLNAKTSNYTLTLDDAGKTVMFSGAAGQTLTIPSFASVYYPVGTEISFVNRAGVDVSIACADTMILAGTFTTGTRTLASQSMAVARKVEGGTWIIGSQGGGLT